MTNLALIVEGEGDVIAAPLLLRRIIYDINPSSVVNILHPIRASITTLRRPGTLERYLELAVSRLNGSGGIFILTDCDWAGACPATDGPILLDRARSARSDIPISVVLANQEFESWFIAAASSLRGHRDLPQDLDPPVDRLPESIRGAKEWLSDKMGRRYSEVSDQPALASIFDINMARHADSFDKCYREVTRLLAEILL